MPLTNLDGVSSAVDVIVDIDGSGATAGVSIKCLTRLISTDMQLDTFVYDTFCTGIDETVRTSKRRTLWQILGFVSSGTTYSKPGSLQGLGPAATLMFQFDTGCTITGGFVNTRDQNQTQALGETARQLEGRFNGAITIAWVVA